MGRTPTPTVLNEINGAYKKNPKRRQRRLSEPNTGRGIGPPPEYLKPLEREIWNEIVGECAPGLFQSSDKFIVASLSRLEAALRTDPDRVPAWKWTIWRQLIAACGMSPSDRTKVHAPIDENEDGKEKPKTGLARFL